MRIIFAAFSLILFVAGCKKNDPIDHNNGSFPGALDSVTFFRTTDSVTIYDEMTILRNYYDNQKRVTKMIYKTYYNDAFRLFSYNGNDMLPYKMADSILQTNDYAKVYSHQFSYDNYSHLVFDSTTSYNRDYSNQGMTYVTKSSKTYKYGQNYRTEKGSQPNVCVYSDTTFFNSNSDVTRLSINCANNYIQYANSYYSDENPLGTLNVSPLYNYLNGLYFYVAIQNLDFNIFQPKLMYQKLSGKNTVYYRSGPNDWNELFFYTEKDANNRIKRLIISNYTYSYNFSGTLYLYDKFLTGYNFFYHL